MPFAFIAACRQTLFPAFFYGQNHLRDKIFFVAVLCGTFKVNVTANSFQSVSLCLCECNHLVSDVGNGLITAVKEDAERGFFIQCAYKFSVTVGLDRNTIRNSVEVGKGLFYKVHSLAGVRTVASHRFRYDFSQMHFPFFDGRRTESL